MAGSLWLFPALTEDSDEGAYLAQSSSLEHGHLVPRAARHHVESFQPWFAVERDRHFVYKYSPVFPGVLAAADVLLFSERAALGIISACAVLLVIAVARELGATRRAALFGGAVFALSPLVALQATTFLPYLANLALMLGFAVTLLRGLRTRSLLLTTTSGALASLAFWTRPFDAALFVAPTLVWAGVRLTKQARPLSPTRLAACFVLGALPGACGFLIYNAATTGNAFALAFRLADQSDTLGFGLRRSQRSDPYLDYTIGRALAAISTNLRLLASWSFGGVAVCALGAYGLAAKRVIRGRTLLLAWLATWPLGFFFFWGSYYYVSVWDGGRLLGPYYYLPMLVPLAIAGGIGADRLAERSRLVTVVASVVAITLTVPVLAAATSRNLERSRKRESVQQAVRAATSGVRALVFVPPVWGPFLQHPFSFLRNAPEYDGNRVYALDLDVTNLDVATERLHRTPFLMSLPDSYYSGPGPKPRVWVDRAALRTGTRVAACVKVPAALTTRALSLRVGLPDVAGENTVEAPVDARSGSACIHLGAGVGALVLSDSTGATSSTTPLDGDGQSSVSGTRLRVDLLRTSPDGGTTVLMSREAWIRAGTRQVTTLWPGTVTDSTIDPDILIHWPATVLDVPA